MQWLARLPGTQEIRGSSPGRGMTDFCTSIFICLYIYNGDIKMYFYLAMVGYIYIQVNFICFGHFYEIYGVSINDLCMKITRETNKKENFPSYI